MKKFSKKINKFLAFMMCSVILFQSSMISVYAAVSASEEDILEFIENLSPELESIVNGSLDELYLTLLTTDDATNALLESVMVELDALTTELETKIESGDESLESLLAIISAYETEVTEVIAPYITETTESYVGEVLALLLTEVESSLTAYAEDLEAKLIESVETVINESIADVILNLTGNEDATEQDIQEFIEAYQNLINNDVEADYEAYTLSSDAVTAYLESDDLASNLENALSDALASANYETLKSSISTDSIDFIFMFYTDSYDMEDIYELVWNDNVSYDTILEEFTGSWKEDTCFIRICGGGTESSINSYVTVLNTTISTVSLASNLTTDEEDDLTDDVYNDDENLQSLLTNQAEALAALTESVSSLIADLETVTEFMDLEIDTIDLLTNIINGDVSVDSIIASVSSETINIKFIIEAMDLTTEFISEIESDDAKTTALITDYITNLTDLIEEYGLEETFEDIILDVIENVEEEFTFEYFEEITTDFVESLTEGVESFSDLLGTDGYPALPSEMIEEMYETALDYLTDVNVDAEYDELISALEEMMTTEVIEEILADIYEDLSEYENILELTYDELVDIIVNNTIAKIVELIEEYFAEDEITEVVDGNTVTTIIPDNIVTDYLENEEDLTIDNTGLEITVDQSALLEIQTTVGTNSFSIVVEDVTDTYELTQELKLLVGDKSIYAISLVDENGENIELTDGSLTIKVPYILADDEFSDSVVLFDATTGEKVESTYESGYITFTTNELSTYAIGYASIGEDTNDDVLEDLTDDETNADTNADNLESDSTGSTSAGTLTNTESETEDEDTDENENSEEDEDDTVESAAGGVSETNEDDSNTGLVIVLSIIGLLVILFIAKKVYDEQTK